MGKLTLTVAAHFADKSKVAYAWKANNGKKDSAQAQSDKLDLALPKKPKADEVALLVQIEAVCKALNKLDGSKITLRINDQQLVDDINEDGPMIEISRRLKKQTHGKKMGAALYGAYSRLFDAAGRHKITAEYVDKTDEVFAGLKGRAKSINTGKKPRSGQKHKKGDHTRPAVHQPHSAAPDFSCK